MQFCNKLGKYKNFGVQIVQKNFILAEKKIGVDWTYIVWDRIIQIVYLFFHVFCKYSVLLITDFTYSRVPGDQGGPNFFQA